MITKDLRVNKSYQVNIQTESNIEITSKQNINIDFDESKYGPAIILLTGNTQSKLSPYQDILKSLMQSLSSVFSPNNKLPGIFAKLNSLVSNSNLIGVLGNINSKAVLSPRQNIILQNGLIKGYKNIVFVLKASR